MILFIREKNHGAVHRFERDDKFPFWTLSHFRSGQCHLRTSRGETFHHGPVFFLVPPHTEYVFETRCDPRTSYHEIFAFFSPPTELLPVLQWPELPLSLASGEPRLIRQVGKRLRDAAACFRPPYRPHYRQWAWNALEEALLMLDALRPTPLSKPRDPRLERALQFIALNYRKPINVEELAQASGLSPSHFAHLFRDEMGVPPMQHLEVFRLDRAVELLLSSNATIREIGEEVGFENASHFTQRFRRRFQCPPKRFRRNPERVSYLRPASGKDGGTR